MPTEEEIKNLLRKLGAKAANHGYSYITYGILLTLKDKSYLEYITKNLYVDIAHNFNTSGSCVERDIRTVVESIWKTDEKELLLEICNGASLTRRPPNRKFFEMMYDYFIKVSSKEADELSVSFPADFSCDKLEEQCVHLKNLYKELVRVNKENIRLTRLLEELRGRLQEQK